MEKTKRESKQEEKRLLTWTAEHARRRDAGQTGGAQIGGHKAVKPQDSRKRNESVAGRLWLSSAHCKEKGDGEKTSTTSTTEKGNKNGKEIGNVRGNTVWNGGEREGCFFAVRGVNEASDPAHLSTDSPSETVWRSNV